MWDSHSPFDVYVLCVGVQRIGVGGVHHRHCILVPLVEHLLLFLGELVVELKEELFRIRIPLREQLVCKPLTSRLAPTFTLRGTQLKISWAPKA